MWTSLINGKRAPNHTKFDTSKLKLSLTARCRILIAQYCEKSEIGKGSVPPYALGPLTKHQGFGAQLGEIDQNPGGVIWGSGNGGFYTFQQEIMEYARGDGTPRINPYFIPKVIVDIASGWIAMKHGFMGLNFTTVSACATSTTAIIDAMNYIRWNKADVIVAGGSEAL